MTFLIVIVVLFAVMWLLLIRPQRRRQQEHMEMQNNLSLGDEIITAGGLHAYVRRLDESVLTVEIAPGTEVRLDRRAVAAVVKPEEPMALDAGEETEDEAGTAEPEPISRRES